MLLVITLMGPVIGQLDCPNREDYSPCTCRNTSYGYSILCNGVSLSNVVDVFKQTTPEDLESVTVILAPKIGTDSQLIIPADLFGNHRITYTLEISCSNLIQIDANAFRSSKNSVQWFTSQNCDFGQLDFDFLEGFNKLYFMQFGAISNFHLANWTNMPPLPSLTFINIFTTDLNDWKEFPHLVSGGLESVQLYGNGIEDVPMNRILDWVLKYSASTLETLSIPYNYLKSIPLQIPLFTNLTTLKIKEQKTPPGIASISKGSLSFSVPVYEIDARNCGIERIESGAFQGIYVDDNKVTSLFDKKKARNEIIICSTIVWTDFSCEIK